MRFIASGLVCFFAIAVSLSFAGRIRHSHIGALNEGLRARGEWKHPVHDAVQSKLEKTQESYFTQVLDHFDRTNNATWQQRYIINDTMWKPGGPILFILGGEGPISTSYVSGHFITGMLAEKYGALQVAVEHRFYGKSVPNGDSSVSNLRFLSSEQALADAAEFRDFIVSTYNCQSCRIVIFGGSYSGCLSAWLKSKYPQLFTGAYATSAPVNASLDFYQYMEVVQNSVGPTCAARIQAANNKLDQLMQTPAGRAQIQSTYQTCSPIVTDKDVSTFFDSVAGAISGIVQYNLDNVNYQPCNITTMCAMIESADPDPVQALAIFNNFANNASGATCTEVNYTDYVQSLLPTSDGRSWTYQTCIEFGFYQTAETSNQPFSRTITLKYFTDLCNDLFGNQLMPDTTWTNTEYGAIDIVTENTFLPNGDVDPWHILGVLGRAVGPDSASVLMEGTAHCADLYQPRAQDLPSLTAGRAIGLALVNDWIT